MRNILRDKKAAEGVMPMVIAVIIGLAILVMALFLIFNVGGWRDKLLGGTFGASNVDDVRGNCKIACDASRSIEYNGDTKSVILPDKKTKFTATCKQLESNLPTGCINWTGSEFVAVQDTNNTLVSADNCVPKWAGNSTTGVCKTKDDKTIKEITQEACGKLFKSYTSITVIDTKCPNA